MPEEYNISIMRPYLFPFPLYLLPLTRVPPRGNAISTYQSAAPASRPRFIAFLVTPCCHIVVTMWSRGDTIVVTMWSRPWHHVFLNPFRFKQFHRALFAEKSPQILPLLLAPCSLLHASRSSPGQTSPPAIVKVLQNTLPNYMSAWADLVHPAGVERRRVMNLQGPLDLVHPAGVELR